MRTYPTQVALENKIKFLTDAISTISGFTAHHPLGSIECNIHVYCEKVLKDSNDMAMEVSEVKND